MVIFYNKKQIESFADNFASAAPFNKGVFVYLLNSKFIAKPAVIWLLKAYQVNSPEEFLESFGQGIDTSLKNIEFFNSIGRVIMPGLGVEPETFESMN